MTYKGGNRRSKLPGRRDTDGTCVFHEIACEKVEDLASLIKSTVSWRVFAATVGAIMMISMAYIGWADSQHNRAYQKAEEAIERTHSNKEKLIDIKVTQTAILKNLEKLMRSQNISPAITTEEVEKEIRENGKDN